MKDEEKKLFKKRGEVNNKKIVISWKLFNALFKNCTHDKDFVFVDNLTNPSALTPKLSHFDTGRYPYVTLVSWFSEDCKRIRAILDESYPNSHFSVFILGYRETEEVTEIYYFNPSELDYKFCSIGKNKTTV